MYRFMVTMCFCHDHQRCVMYVLSYVSVVDDLYLPPFVQVEFRA